jgi:PBP1b-binding outer membrane lipoprotein LpoB
MMMRLQTRFVLLICLLLGGCATYNATVPEWAQIAAESTEAAIEKDARNHKIQPPGGIQRLGFDHV